jgi:methylphosphotriester-DNA--protein-cysteine methyltransferase
MLSPVRLMILAGGAVLMAASSGCSRTNTDEVFAVERTKTYHRAGCPPLRMARTTVMATREVRSRSFKPCQLCKPDSL